MPTSLATDSPVYLIVPELSGFDSASRRYDLDQIPLAPTYAGSSCGPFYGRRRHTNSHIVTLPCPPLLPAILAPLSPPLTEISDLRLALKPHLTDPVIPGSTSTITRYGIYGRMSDKEGEMLRQDMSDSFLCKAAVWVPSLHRLRRVGWLMANCPILSETELFRMRPVVR